jgi:hypothetical protein
MDMNWHGRMDGMDEGTSSTSHVFRSVMHSL